MRKTMILVGAGPGLGNAIAREFAKHDFIVVLMSRSQERLNNYAREFIAAGHEVYTKTVDALHPGTLTQAFSEIMHQLGLPDAVVYNVGYTVRDHGRPISSDDLLQRYQVDVASAWHCAGLVALPEFGKKKGAILFTGGRLAKIIRPASHYIGKAALGAMTAVLRQALTPMGIFVGSVRLSQAPTPGDERFDPALIAQEFWKLYSERKEADIFY